MGNERNNVVSDGSTIGKGRYGVKDRMSNLSEYDWFRGVLYVVVVVLNVAAIVTRAYAPEHAAPIQEVANYLSGIAGITGVVHLANAKDQYGNKF